MWINEDSKIYISVKEDYFLCSRLVKAPMKCDYTVCTKGNTLSKQLAH